GKGRQKADWKRWRQIKAENADLADVLDLLPNGNLKELALSHVCDQLGTNARAQVYRQIKIAWREGRESQMQQGMASIEAMVSRAIDGVEKKGSRTEAL